MHIDTIPVFLVNQGYQPCLYYAIESAKQYNNHVILLGDEFNRGFGDEWYPIEEYISEENHRFQKVYRHLSTNAKQFEMICFLRFFILYDFMVKHNLKKCVYIDSDVLSFVDYTDYYTKHRCNCSLVMDETLFMSGHCSFWTVDFLRDFLLFLLDMYENHVDKLKKILANMRMNGEVSGGICDMTLLTLWGREKDGIWNIARYIDEEVFDHNINSSKNYVRDEYKMNCLLRMKKIIYKKNKKPYFISKDGRLIKVNCIHCQGGAKSIMHGIWQANHVEIFIHRMWFVLKTEVKTMIGYVNKWF